MAYILVERNADKIDNMLLAKEYAEKLSSNLLDDDIFIVEYLYSFDEYDDDYISESMGFWIMRRHPQHGSFRSYMNMTFEAIDDMENPGQWLADSFLANFELAIKEKEKSSANDNQ